MKGTVKTTANGIEMHYELSGAGECLVLIHGYSDNLDMWYNQAPHFAGHCRVLTYDVRGFGQTELKRPYSMDVFADDLYELLHALDITSACVLGYSMGGRIGLEFALKHQEMTAGLIFANSGIGHAPDPDMEERRKMMMGILQQGDIEVISAIMATASFSPGFEERNPAAFQKYKEIKMRNDPSPYLEIMQAIVGSIDTPQDLRRLKCPVLIIAGENDGFMDVDIAEAMKNSIDDAALRIFPTGHAAAIEVPEEFNDAVLNFVKKLEWS